MKRIILDTVLTVKMVYLFAIVMPIAFIISKFNMTAAKYAVYAGEWPFEKIKGWLHE